MKKYRRCIDCGKVLPLSAHGLTKRCDPCKVKHSRVSARDRQRRRRQESNALADDAAYRRALVALKNRHPDEFERIRRAELRKLVAS